MADKEDFLSARFRCSRCGNMGIILAVAANQTRVVLDGFCIQCAGGKRTVYDLLNVDRFLRREDEKVHNTVQELLSLEDDPT